MIVVGICDGEQAVRSLLANYVERFRTETGEEIQLLSYSTGEKLLKNYMLDGRIKDKYRLMDYLWRSIKRN